MVWQADNVAAMAMSERFFQNMASKLTTRAGHSSGIQLGKLGTVGLAAAIFIPWMNISGSVLANYWSKWQPK